MATCPLCSTGFDGGEPYRDHLEQAHGLRDDEGTATVTQIRAHRIEDDAAMSLMAEAMLGDAPSEPAPTVEPGAGVPGAAEVFATRAAPSPAGAGRYPLAMRHGDVALYAPGVLLLVTAVARLEADVLGVLLVVLGTLMAVLGMLLPLVLGRR